MAKIDRRFTRPITGRITDLITGDVDAPREGVGVPVYLTINGMLAILLLDSDGTPLQDIDGTYLYEAV